LATIVTASTIDNPDTSTTITTPSFNAITGNAIIVAFTSQELGFTGATITSCTDTSGNAYTALSSEVGPGGGEAAVLLYARNITGNANNTVTLTLSAVTRYKSLGALQVSGLDTSSDIFINQSSGTSSTTSISTGAISTSTSSIIVAAASCSNDRTWTPGANYTEWYDGFAGVGSVSNTTGFFQYRIISGAGSYNASATLSSAGNQVLVAAAFKDVGGSPTPSPSPVPRLLIFST
jgi:hypothetical protein